MIVVFLQNAWSRMYAGGTWPRESWLMALHRSRSGQRLKVMTDAAAGREFWFDNTTQIVGEEPSSVVNPDLIHMRYVINFQRPEAIVACGKQAADCLMKMGEDTPILIVPHPAYRVLTNDLYVKAGRLLADGFDGIVELKQERKP